MSMTGVLGFICAAAAVYFCLMAMAAGKPEPKPEPKPAEPQRVRNEFNVHFTPDPLNQLRGFRVIEENGDFMSVSIDMDENVRL